MLVSSACFRFFTLALLNRIEVIKKTLGDTEVLAYAGAFRTLRKINNLVMYALFLFSF